MMHTYQSEGGLSVGGRLYSRWFQSCTSLEDVLRGLHRVWSLPPTDRDLLLGQGGEGPVSLTYALTYNSCLADHGEQALVLAALVSRPFSAELSASRLSRGRILTVRLVELAVDLAAASPTDLLLGVLSGQGGRRPRGEEEHGDAVLPIVRSLVGRGADLEANATPGSGNTALHLACMAGDRAVCEFLVLHGADKDRPNAAGRTPLQLAGRTVRSALCELDPPATMALRALDDICVATGLNADLADLVLRGRIRHGYSPSAMEDHPSLVFWRLATRKRKAEARITLYPL
jgi:hypothetical protein